MPPPAVPQWLARAAPFSPGATDTARMRRRQGGRSAVSICQRYPWINPPSFRLSGRHEPKMLEIAGHERCAAGQGDTGDEQIREPDFLEFFVQSQPVEF